MVNFQNQTPDSFPAQSFPEPSPHLAYGSVGAVPSGPSPYVPSPTEVEFHVWNGRTAIRGAYPHLLDIIDKDLRYPSEMATALERGFAPPEVEATGWDGWIRLLHQPKTMDPWFPTGLLARIMRLTAAWQYPYRVIDHREKPEPGFPEPPAIPLRDYQKAAVDTGEYYGRGVFDIPPRGGKTRSLSELIRRIALPTVWIAPTDRIVTQTFEVLEGFFGRNYAYQLVGTANAPEAARHHIVVCTAATANLLPEEFYATRQVVVVDEWHHGAAKTYREIFAKCEHVYYRFGMTGTHFRSGEDDLAMHSLLGESIFKISSQFLLDQGYLVPTRVVFLPVLAPRLRGVPRGFITGHGKFGIHEHEYRNNLVTYAAVTLYHQGRKVLVLVGTKAQGRILQKMIAGYLAQPPNTEFKKVEFLSTDTQRGKQGKIIEAFLNTDEVRILIGTSLLGEGVDLPNVDGLVYARGEKAEVSLTQNAYRVCTKLEGKRDAVIVDFADRHNAKLLKHSKERLGVYYDEPTFQVSVLQDPADFEKWLMEGPKNG